MKTVYQILLLFTEACLILSIYVHGRALLGLSVSQTPWYNLLHIGIFAVMLSLLIACQFAGVNTQRGDFLKIVQKGAPLALRRIPVVLTVYTVVAFAWMIWSTRNSAKHSSVPPPPIVISAFSAAWMMFYGTASVAFYSLSQRPDLIEELRIRKKRGLRL